MQRLYIYNAKHSLWGILKQIKVQFDHKDRVGSQVPFQIHILTSQFTYSEILRSN